MAAEGPHAHGGDGELCRAQLRRGIWAHALKLNEGVDRARRPLAWILDCRQTLLTTRYLPCAGRLVWRKVRRYSPDLVGGLTLSADPLTVAVLYEAAAEGRCAGGFTIRKRPKPHGLRKLVEGQAIRSGSSVVLLDDVISSGRSLLRAHDIVTAAGATVVAAVVLVDYRRRRVDRFDRLGIPVEAIFTLPDLGLAAQPPANPAAARLTWRYPGLMTAQVGTPSPGSCHDPHRNAVVAAGDAGVLVSLTRDGAQRWRYPDTGTLGLLRGAPVVCHEAVVVVVGDCNGVVHCVDADSGRASWTSSVPGLLTSPAAVDHRGQRVLVGSARGNGCGWLTALRSVNGAPMWTLGVRPAPHTGPVFDEQRAQVILGLGDGRLIAVDTDDQRLRWTCPAEATIPARPALGDGVLFSAGSGGFLYAVSLTDGQVVWRRRLADRLCCSPAVAGRLVIVGADHKVIALDCESGGTEWIAPVAGRVLGGPSAVGNGLVAVGSDQSELSILDLASGRVVWTHQTGSPIRSSPTASAGLITVCCSDGQLYAFEFSAHANQWEDGPC